MPPSCNVVGHILLLEAWPSLGDYQAFACWISQLRIQEAIRLQLERADYMEGFLLTQSHEDQQINVKGGEKKKRWETSQSLVAFVCFFFRMCLFCFVLLVCFVST